MSQTDNSTKSDKINALTLAKECYSMKLELLTNVTVVDDTIRFVASNAVKTTEKANFGKMITVDKEVNHSSGSQGSEESCSQEQ
jgi:hypothetical protein